ASCSLPTQNTSRFPPRKESCSPLMLPRSDQPLIFPESYRYRREKGWACVQREFQTYDRTPGGPVPWNGLQVPGSRSRPRPHRCEEGQFERTRSLSSCHANRPLAGSFQMELIAVGLAADSVNKSVALYLLAALQLSKNTT